MAGRSGPRQPVAPQPKLAIPLQEALDAIDEQIRVGEQLESEPPASEDALLARQRVYGQWKRYNEEWLRGNIGPTIADEFAGRGGFHIASPDLRPPTFEDRVRRLKASIERDLDALDGFRDMMPLWAPKSSRPQSSGAAADVPLDGPIFVVHGHDHGRAHEVARVIERSTGRDAVILHEQANGGRTLIEKFEKHSANAAFAVVLLTADDEGRARAGAAELELRGRQNVIFELGFFFGGLGRSRVAVLFDQGVKEPSDIDGLAYIPLDAAGAWKQDIAREMEAAGIQVDRAKIP